MLFPRIPKGGVVSVAKMILGGHEIEYAYFREKGDVIPPHTHEDGHHTILLMGSVEANFWDGTSKILKEPFEHVYFNADEQHWIKALEDTSVTIQYHDFHDPEWFALYKKNLPTAGK